MQEYNNSLPKGHILDNKYKIDTVLGEGGFGITYKALDTVLEKEVVIKEYMPNDYALRHSDNSTISLRSKSNEELFNWGLDSFKKEAQALAKFNHPNIVRVESFFTQNNTAYFVMPYERGMDLDKYMKSVSGVFSEQEIIDIIVPILNGLKETHKKDIIHRDIKPGNIFIRRDNSPMLIDFGASRVALGEKSKSITQILTPPYAPTEQYGSDRKKQGAWSDIYSIGMVMYKMITNTKTTDIPASTDRSSAVYLDDEQDPLKYPTNPNISQNLINVTIKALSIKSKDRYQSVQDMIEDLMQDSNQKIEAENTTSVKSNEIDKSSLDVDSTQHVGNNEILSSVVAILVALIIIIGLIGYNQKLKQERIERIKQERQASLNNVFTDNSTNLMWQDNKEARTLKLNWDDAEKHCKNLTLGGYSDWYLPSRKQLRRLYEKKKLLKNVKEDWYWSSSVYVSYSNYSWVVDFKDGDGNFSHESNKYFVRCVRGRQ